MNKADFIFYSELNDFLLAERRDRTFSYDFNGSPAIKDSTEALGVPHVEINVILVNGVSVDFSYQLQNGDSVSVYPAGVIVDASRIIKLRPPLPETRFILDVHLGKLASKLRMLGFDTLYRNDYDDAEIVEIAVKESRVILTRDRGLLMHKVVTHGYCVRSDQSDEQLPEVLKHFGIYAKVRAFHRCIACNGVLERMDKKEVMDRLQEKTISFFNEFYVCSDCNQVYWKGSHYQKMKGYVENLLEKSRG